MAENLPYHEENRPPSLAAEGFFAPLPLLGTRPQRNTKWSDPAIHPKESIDDLSVMKTFA